MEDQRTSTRTNPIKAALAFLGPGLFLIGYNIGTGSVTQMASAGSRWGMKLSWTVFLASFFVFVVVGLFGRYTLATGETILFAIRRHMGPFGPAISLFIMITLILAEFVGVTGLSAVMVDLLCEWCRAVPGVGAWNVDVAGRSIDGLRLFFALMICASVGGVLWRGRYGFLETVLAVLVAVMGGCFLVTAVLLVPSWREIAAGLVPGVPDDPNALLIVAGVSGTTFSTAMFYCRSITIKAKGWGLEQGRRAWIDAVVSASAMFLLSIAVMICAAGTLYRDHIPVEKTVQMVQMLAPLAGPFALTVFVIGILGAGLSSLFPTILIAPWLISDFRGQAIDPRSWTSRGFVVLGAAFAIVGPFFGKIEPVQLMNATMAMLAVVTPFSIVAIAVLLNQKRLGASRNTWLMNLGCLGAFVFSVAMQYCAVVSLAPVVGGAFKDLFSS